MSMKSLVMAIGVMLLAVPLSAAEEPEVIVEIDRSQIYEGESILYRITVNHVDSPSPPELRGLDEFTVTKLGEQPLNSRSITIINGVRSDTVRLGRQYNYRLTPKRSGTVTIPAPVAHVAGKEIRGRAVTIRVVAPQIQDTVILNVSSDRKSVYPMQPFTVSLIVAVKPLAASYADRNPVAIQSTPPKLSIPWANDDQLPDGLEPEVDWRHWLGPLQDRHGNGFQINNIGGNSVFSLFDTTTSFQPAPRRVRRLNQQGQEIDYWEFRLDRRFVPKQVGTYVFGPVSLKGTFAAFDPTREELVPDQIYAVAKSIAVVVKDVPVEGRPETFLGTIGRFTFQAELAPTRAQVGDPMTLTLTLDGQGTLDQATAPDLTQIPAIAELFKTYEATSKTVGDSVHFTYSLRPMRADVTEFPSVPISYFDVELEKYVTLRSEPIPVQISEAQRLTNDEVIARSAATGPDKLAIETSNEGVFANIADASALEDETVRPTRWLAVWSGMLATYLVVSLVLTQIIARRRDPALQRRRAAPATAFARLQCARQLFQNGEQADAIGQLRAAFTGLAADVDGESGEGMTPRDVQKRLEELDTDTTLNGRVFALLEQCDAARYGAMPEETERFERDARSLLSDLIHDLKAKKHLS